MRLLKRRPRCLKAPGARRQRFNGEATGLLVRSNRSWNAAYAPPDGNLSLWSAPDVLTHQRLCCNEGGRVLFATIEHLQLAAQPLHIV